MTSVLGYRGKEVGDTSTLTCPQEKATVQQIQDAMPKATGFFGPTFVKKTVHKDIYDLAEAGKLVHKVVSPLPSFSKLIITASIERKQQH
jgi:hypothetical protein